ncbi:hypothetical protein [Streptomyces sp. CA-251251]|uniref:hypothetical protein n=1 Tax=Streptomyces sp. CA-251251 TaxID=3240063 RepID=UPI003D93C8E7
MKPGLSHVSEGDDFEYLVPVLTAVDELHLALAEADVSHIVAPGETISNGVDLCISPDTAVWLANLVRATSRAEPPAT